jgi:chromosome partitioning protein
MLAAAADRCDVVVVDTPPGLGPISRRVLASSDRVLVPLQCEPLVLQTTPQILRAIQDAVGEHPQLKFDGLLLTMYEAGNVACERTAEYIRSHVPANMVFDLVIPRSTAVSEAFGAGQPAVLRSPADEASQAYVKLASLLAERFAT